MGKKQIAGREEPAPATSTASIPIKPKAVPANSDITDKKKRDDANMKKVVVAPVAT